MTKEKENTKSTYLPNNGNLRIPTREEFHRTKMNNISICDFCTCYPTGYVIKNIAESLEWTFAHM